MSQEAPAVTDVPHPSESDAGTADAPARTHDVGTDADTDTVAADAGPGASEGGFAVRFGGGFAIGMLAGGLVGVGLDSLPLAMFGGFILGTLVGTVLAARG
jgi:predicted lipid-binding transport protein (Tim44 family)